MLQSSIRPSHPCGSYSVWPDWAILQDLKWQNIFSEIFCLVYTSTPGHTAQVKSMQVSIMQFLYCYRKQPGQCKSEMSTSYLSFLLYSPIWFSLVISYIMTSILAWVIKCIQKGPTKDQRSRWWWYQTLIQDTFCPLFQNLQLS